MVGKGRAPAFIAVTTCAGVSVDRCENIKAATPVANGAEKLVPTSKVVLSHQVELTGPWRPLFDAASSGYRHAEPRLVLTQLPPGAAMPICGPRSEYPTLVPAWRSAATVSTPRQLPGSPTGWPALLPPATTTRAPAAVTSSMAS